MCLPSNSPVRRTSQRETMTYESGKQNRTFGSVDDANHGACGVQLLHGVIQAPHDIVRTRGLTAWNNNNKENAVHQGKHKGRDIEGKPTAEDDADSDGRGCPPARQYAREVSQPMKPTHQSLQITRWKDRRTRPAPQMCAGTASSARARQRALWTSSFLPAPPAQTYKQEYIIEETIMPKEVKEGTSVPHDREIAT